MWAVAVAHSNETLTAVPTSFPLLTHLPVHFLASTAWFFPSAPARSTFFFCGGRWVQRRFIIVEALYSTSGDFAPMVDIIRLKNEYKFRLILDESNSMGVMGKESRSFD